MSTLSIQTAKIQLHELEQQLKDVYTQITKLKKEQQVLEAEQLKEQELGIPPSLFKVHLETFQRHTHTMFPYDAESTSMFKLFKILYTGTGAGKNYKPIGAHVVECYYEHNQSHIFELEHINFMFILNDKFIKTQPMVEYYAYKMLCVELSKIQQKYFTRQLKPEYSYVLEEKELLTEDYHTN
jgi:hypothetical protein